MCGAHNLPMGPLPQCVDGVMNSSGAKRLTRSSSVRRVFNIAVLYRDKGSGHWSSDKPDVVNARRPPTLRISIPRKLAPSGTGPPWYGNLRPLASVTHGTWVIRQGFHPSNSGCNTPVIACRQGGYRHSDAAPAETHLQQHRRP